MRTNELSGYTPYSVLPALVQEYRGTWAHPALQCVEAVQSEVWRVAETAVRDHFQQYPAAEAEIR